MAAPRRGRVRGGACPEDARAAAPPRGRVRRGRARGAASAVGRGAVGAAWSAAARGARAPAGSEEQAAAAGVGSRRGAPGAAAAHGNDGGVLGQALPGGVRQERARVLQEMQREHPQGFAAHGHHGAGARGALCAQLGGVGGDPDVEGEGSWRGRGCPPWPARESLPGAGRALPSALQSWGGGCSSFRVGGGGSSCRPPGRCTRGLLEPVQF